jgi:hypothetical protein
MQSIAASGSRSTALLTPLLGQRVNAGVHRASNCAGKAKSPLFVRIGSTLTPNFDVRIGLNPVR